MYSHWTESMCSPLAKTETGTPEEPVGGTPYKADMEMGSHKKTYGNGTVRPSLGISTAEKFQSAPTISSKVGLSGGNGTPGDQSK